MQSAKDRATIDDIMNSLRVVVHEIRVSSRAAEEEAGLTGAQLFVLEKLADVTSLSLNELAERTHTHQSTVSVVVSKLVERKLLKRVRSEEDGRKVVLSLTELGRKRLDHAPETAQTRIVEALGAMSAEQRNQFSSLLSGLLSGAGFEKEKPRLFFEGGLQAGKNRNSSKAESTK